MKNKIKELAPVSIFLPTVNQILQIFGRTRDNLSSIQIIQGYVGYLYYAQYDMEGLGEWVSDNGQIFKKEPVQELYKNLTEAIPEVLEAAYGNAALPYVVLNEGLASRSVTVYKEYNDEYAYGEEIVCVYQDKEDAKAHLKSQVESYFKKTWDELEKPQVREELGFTEDDHFGEEYISFYNGNSCLYWIVDEQEVTKKASHCEDSKCSKNTIYSHDEAARILGLFEDVLESNGIKVPSPEDDDRREDNEAVLYGSVYSDLLEQVEDVLLEIINRTKNSTVIEYEFSGTV